MVYNFNLGIGWASSGVEYAEKYRNICFKKAGIDAKFIFFDMIQSDNIEHMTRNMGFDDEQIIWFYSYFTDFEIAPTVFSTEDFEDTIDRKYEYKREGKKGRYYFEGNDFYTVYYVNDISNCINRVEYVSRGCLIRKDYFTTGRLFTEYYAPKDGRAQLYMRRFFNKDGSVCYEEIIDGEKSEFRFSDKVFESKEELVSYFVKSLKLSSDDTVLIDRSTGIGQSILENAGSAKVGVVIHAEHYSLNSLNKEKLLWNNYYEYQFSMHNHIDFYITATKLQKDILEEQFIKVYKEKPNVIAIPVGNIDKLRDGDDRKPYSMIVAARLATEKHIDTAVRACAMAKKEIKKISFDIYGEGPLKKDLKKLIDELGASDYIKLKGQQNLEEVYKEYELYLSTSHSEGFGLSLMEAIGSGDALIGYDVPYGNKNFISDGKNGYLIELDEMKSENERVVLIKDAIVKYFKNDDRIAFKEKSLELAEEYLTEEVSKLWADLVR